MALAPGIKLGPYEILAPLGAGGMGEVYRARDSRLGRDVAVKVLPQHLSSNAEVRARFEREAKTVSSLNHPNICVLHDIGREGDIDYLVMELVDGETLAARLARGALPAADVIRIGSELADALDRAHRAGVVHRDLKPGNVMLTKSGAKLMDFGLARATGMAGPTSGSGVTVFTHSPTVAQPLTAEGTIVGTFQYMSPEQLEGKEADAGADVWALGCVLYEMATGKRAFGGKSQASLITSIMGSEPAALSQVAPMMPPALERLVQACLAKDPTARLQSAHDIKLQLSWISEGGSQAGVPKVVARKRRSRERLAWTVAAVAIVVAAGTAAFSRRPAPETQPVHASLQPPRGVLFSSSTDKPLPLAISPNGSVVAFCARAGEGPDVLWVRSLGQSDAHPLAGTEGAEGPFFSPDGRALGFFADGILKRVDVAGGPVITLVGDRVDPRGGTWSQDGHILFTRDSYGPVSMVAADGGTVSSVTALDSTRSEATHRYPYLLPDGRHFLYLARRSGAGAGESPIIYVGEIGSTERKQVLEVASNVVYASGHLLYVRGTVLVAQRFDAGSLAVTGPAIPLVDDVRMDERFSRGVFAASTNGVLVCMTGNTQSRTQLRWLDRSGRALGDVGEPADYTYGGTPNISPDGGSAVLPIANLDRGTSDVWLVDLTSGRRRKLTVDADDHPAAVWLPDGRSVAVTSRTSGPGGLDVLAIDGTQSRRIVPTADFAWPQSAWGDRLLFWIQNPAGQRLEVVLQVVSPSGNGDAQLFMATKSGDTAQFSPDGRWVAYVSEETGRPDVFVAAFPQPGGRWQVSQAGGTEPRWNRNGRELFFIDLQNNLVSVEVEATTAGFQPGAARELFQFHGAGGLWRYDVSPDGDRFLVTDPLDEDLASPVTLITDWTRKLETR